MSATKGHTATQPLHSEHAPKGHQSEGPQDGVSGMPAPEPLALTSVWKLDLLASQEKQLCGPEHREPGPMGKLQ